MTPFTAGSITSEGSFGANDTGEAAWMMASTSLTTWSYAPGAVISVTTSPVTLPEYSGNREVMKDNCSGLRALHVGHEC